MRCCQRSSRSLGRKITRDGIPYASPQRGANSVDLAMLTLADSCKCRFIPPVHWPKRALATLSPTPLSLPVNDSHARNTHFEILNCNLSVQTDYLNSQKVPQFWRHIKTPPKPAQPNFTINQPSAIDNRRQKIHPFMLACLRQRYLIERNKT